MSAIARGEVPDGLRDRLAPIALTIEGDGEGSGEGNAGDGNGDGNNEGDGDGVGTVALRPARPFEPETLHTLVITNAVRIRGRRLVRGVERPFTTGAAGSGAPWVELVRPAPGSVDVVQNLRAVDVRFSRPVRFVDAESLRLVDDDGGAVEVGAVEA